MSVDFALNYRDGIDYTDLFFATKMGAITDGQDLYEMTKIDVNIPVTTSQSMSINVPAITEAMANSSFRVYLKSTGKDAEKAYSTITTMQTEKGRLNIIRAYSFPKIAIDVTLVFLEKNKVEAV